ncbi:MAG: monofunctional biosynthetic peptidoglycan transglycosylase [Myxococcaceae bacterium]
MERGRPTHRKVTAPRRWPPWVTWTLRLAAGWVVATALPVLAMRWINPPTTVFILEREAAARAHPNPKFHVEQLWVPRSRISTQMVHALIASEDARFLEHHGFDWDAMAAALEDRVEGKSKRGGSTLSQQVAKNLFLWPARSWVRKGLEAWFTLLLELLWSKERILEVHLNIAEYGDGVYGVETAARRYFQKSAAALTLEEASQLVVVLPAPKSRHPNALTARQLERAAWVREQVARLGPERFEGL